MNQTEINRLLKPQPICIQLDESNTLKGELNVPDLAKAIVVFVNGSRIGRHTPANLFISRALIEKGIATLVIDLLTEDEQLSDTDFGASKNDAAMLGDRIVALVDWLAVQDKTMGLKIGLFGIDIATPAMLLAAVRRYKWISTVVSASGRPDLVGSALTDLDCPLLFVVGEQNRNLIKLNKNSLALIQCQKELSIVRGASDHFEEPGTVQELAELSVSWFQSHLD